MKKEENMEVVIGKMAGFCAGVENAVKKAEECIKEKGTVYCLGEIVHNKQVINSLKQLNFLFHSFRYFLLSLLLPIYLLLP